MTLSEELAYATATELALRIRRRELSPVEVVDAFIARMCALRELADRLRRTTAVSSSTA